MQYHGPLSFAFFHGCSGHLVCGDPPFLKFWLLPSLDGMHPLWGHIVPLIYLMAHRMLASDVCPPASSKGRYCHVYLWTAGHPFPNFVLCNETCLIYWQSACSGRKMDSLNNCMGNPCTSGCVSKGLSTGVEAIYAVRGKFHLLSPTSIHLTWSKYKSPPSSSSWSSYLTVWSADSPSTVQGGRRT